MDYTRILICVAIMAIVTYIPRVLPLAIFKKKIKNRYIKSFLAYVPYAVLTAMTFPEVLYSTANFAAAIGGLAAAILLAYRGKSLLTVAIGSIVTIFVLEQIINIII
ncbi:MAG: AzlD domain-containing protein [Oscillospiraceae bacterium]